MFDVGNWDYVTQATAFMLCASGFALCLAALAEYLEWRGHKDEQDRNNDL